MSLGSEHEREQGDGDNAPAPFVGYKRLQLRPSTPAPVADSLTMSTESDVPAGILNYWNMLAKWRWLIAGGLILGVAFGVFTTVTTTPVYRASSTVQIDMEPEKVKAVQTQQYFDGDYEKYAQTQYELLRSRTLARRVVEHEGLATDPKFLGQWSKSSNTGTAAAQPRTEAQQRAALDRATGMVTGALKVEPVRNSRVVKISYESPDPVIAAKIANAVAANYINWNLERRYEASAAARKFLEDRLQQTRQALENSQRRGNDYAQKNQLISLNDNPATSSNQQAPTSSLAATDLVVMNEALAGATSARIQAEQRWRQASVAPDMTLPDVLSNPAVMAIKSARDTAMAEYQQNLRLYKPDYPAMVEAKAKIDTLDQQLAAQARSIRNSLKVQFDVALNNERQLQGEVNRRKAELLTSQGKRVEQGFIDTDVNTSRTLYDSMLSTYKEIGIAGAVTENNIAFVDRAETPKSPFKPEPRKNLMLFATLGLLIGAGLAMLLEAFDLSMKVPEDVEKQLGLPVLGTIPVMDDDKSPARALEDPKSRLSEGYYSVRAALQFSTEDGAPSSLLITSSTPSEGKSTSALAIASGFARLGYRVLLIDADMRDPSLHKMLARDHGVGLSNLLAGGADASPSLQPTSYTNLTFLSSGPLPPNPAELLGGGRMRAFLEAAKLQFDMVVIDAPPVMGLADAPQLASVVQGVVMVVEAAKTKRDLAKGAVRRLRASNARIVGSVMTKFDLRKAGYAYGHAYGSGYGYGYGFDYGAHPAKITQRVGINLPLLGRKRR